MSFLVGIISIFTALHIPKWIGWQWGYLKGRRTKAAVAFGIMFIISGTTHFTNPEGFVVIMPPFLPEPLLLVFISGIAEIGLGAGLLVSRLRLWAGVGAILLLFSVFPANVYAAMNGIISPGASENSLYLWLRLPLQLVFIAWVWWATAGEVLKYLSINREEKQKSV